MKLNMDCVRAVMLCVEEHTDYNHCCQFIHYMTDDIAILIGGDGPGEPTEYQRVLEKSYDNDDIFYSVQNCAESGFLVLGATDSAHRIIIRGLTPAGHSFIENIRSDKHWAKIKQMAIKAGAFTVGAVADIAKDVAVSLATQALPNMK